MQPNIDMSVIREALARRQSGGMGGGTSMPAATQMSGAGAAMTSAPQQAQTPSMSQLPNQVPQASGQANQQLQAGQKAQGPMFDEETRTLAKSLVQRLLKGI